MKVSVITTCYNRANTIRNTIDSVLAQDYPNIEYIIIDGASTDDSVNLIKEYEDRITKFISEPDRGMYEALNKGIRIATGDIIGLMHSDDEFYDNQVISRIVEVFKKKNPDMLYANGLFVNAEDTTRIIRRWISGKKSDSKLKRGWLPLHTTTYFQQDILEKYGLYNETYRIAADTEFLTRYMYKYKVKSYYLNEYVVKMKMGGASTDIKRVFTKWKEDIRVYKRHKLNPYITLPAKVISKIPQFIHNKH